MEHTKQELGLQRVKGFVLSPCVGCRECKLIVTNLILSFCRPLASAQGLLMAIMNIQSSVQCFHWYGYNLPWCETILELQC